MQDSEVAEVEAYLGVGNGAVGTGADLHVENGSAGKVQTTVSITYKPVKPHLMIPAPKAADAISFYKKAFGAEELQKTFYPKRKAEQEQPLIMHSHLRFGGTDVYLADETEEAAEKSKLKSPAALSGTSVGLHLDTNDVDAAVARAIEAGATLEMEVADQFWGERYGAVVDPFGYVWSFSTPLATKEPATLPEVAVQAEQVA